MRRGTGTGDLYFFAPMEQIRAFVQFRDKNLDHQLFGALDNHRDLIVVC